MKVNLLAVVGGVLGVMCVIMPWVVTETSSFLGDSRSESTMADMMHDQDSAFAVAVALFMLGSALALATPLGGMGQLFGWLIFLGAILGRLGTESNDFFTTTVSLGVGFALGTVALAVVLFSILRPLGPGYSRAKVQPRDRFLTWSG